jgi:hypothetical protein
MEAALSERLDARRYLGPLGFPDSFCEGRATKKARSAWWPSPSLRFPHQGRFGQGKEDNLLTGNSADVVVHADDLDAGDFPDQLLHERSSCLEKMFAYLLEQIAPFFDRQRFD